MILEILFWLSVVLIFHSYLLYPQLLKILSRNKKENSICHDQVSGLPFVSIIMSVHNEEMVITEKVRSIYYTLYPPDKFEVLVGSDNSTDGTDTICKVFTENYTNFRFYPFTERQGKPSVINQLKEKAKGEVLVLTDAKVFFEINTITELVKHFKNPDIDIVGGNIRNQNTTPEGISIQEKAFMSREIMMKYMEGIIWGKTMGIYGAVYAIRKEAFTPVPPGYSVDDFFITMNVLRNNRKAILNLNANSHENVPDELSAEFKRKVRISAGNFQNLRHFASCLWPPFSSLSFVFASHKAIRWIGPFLILLILILNIILALSSGFYSLLLYIQIVLGILPLIDLLLRKFKVHSVFLRFITHFYAMNFALLVGFFKYITGTKTNIWQPTRR